MSPKDGPRDWDKELADIDKLIDAGPAPAAAPPKKGGPPPRAPSGSGGGGGASAGGSRMAAMRYTALFTWIRLILALGLGLGMTQWPYTHGCGLPLYGYLAAVGAVILASSWSLVSSWHSRSGFAHFLSIALMFWGGALAAREVLPRVGYARESAGWECRAPAARQPAVGPAIPPAAPRADTVLPAPAAQTQVAPPPAAANPAGQTQKQPVAPPPPPTAPAAKRP